MSLENLPKTRQLEPYETNAGQERNAVSYSGRDMDMASVKACMAAGEDLLHHVKELATS
jgi:hypothetical protein